jgi:hypothetical protein
MKTQHGGKCVNDTLKSGSSQETISKNIATEKRAHPEMSNAQATAISYNKARESK